MTPLSLLLVLAAACCHATWNYFVKRINGGPELVWLFSVITAVLYLPIAIWAFHANSTPFGPAEILVCVGSAALHMAYFLLLQRGYRHGDLSVVYPTARATGPMLSTAFAVAFLGEQLTWPVFLGAAAIVIGVLFLTGGLRNGPARPASSLAFGLGVGLIIGVYTVFDAYAVSVLVISPILLDYASCLLRGALLAPIASRRKDLVMQHWRDHRLAVVVIAIFNPLAYILVLVALTFTPVIYVAPAREVSVLLTVMLGTLVLGEGEFRNRIVWAVLILFGMTLLTIA